jgi:hypothetical protein
MADDAEKDNVNPIEFSMKFREVSEKQSLRLLCHDLLEECEPLFPGTVEARNHLWVNHAKIFSEIQNITSFFKGDIDEINEIDVKMESEVGFLLGAQKWFVRDLIICIQNIALCRITNQTITEKNYPIEIKHVRLKTNKKMKIVFENRENNYARKSIVKDT